MFALLNLLAPVVGTVVQDAYTYFTKNGGINSTTVATGLSLPAILSTVDSLSNNVDLVTTVQSGNNWMALAAGLIMAARFGLYLWRKSQSPAQ